MQLRASLTNGNRRALDGQADRVCPLVRCATFAPVERSALNGGRMLALGTVVSALALGACGGEEQGADEPSGTFDVSVVKASFPSKQHLSRAATMVIAVKNTGNKTVPDLAVTVDSFAAKSEQPDLADPARAAWIVDESPAGGDSAYVDTWALGRLRPGQTRRFVWHVTAVKPGTHTIKWRVAAGLNGKALARTGDDRTPQGQFTVDVSDTPSQSRVDPGTGEIIRSS